MSKPVFIYVIRTMMCGVPKAIWVIVGYEIVVGTIVAGNITVIIVSLEVVTVV